MIHKRQIHKMPFFFKIEMIIDYKEVETYSYIKHLKKNGFFFGFFLRNY